MISTFGSNPSSNVVPVLASSMANEVSKNSLCSLSSLVSSYDVLKQAQESHMSMFWRLIDSHGAWLNLR